MSGQRRPDVIGIGCQRCASSTTHDLLNQHPEVGKPPRGLHFFSKDFSRGVSWYEEQLSPFAHKHVLLEFSVSYSYPEFCDQAAQRIHEQAPDARLFLSVRNPIDRAFSDYMRSLRRCEIHKRIGFEKALRQYPAFLERGRYCHIVSQYLRYFPRDRLRVLFYDDLTADSRAYVQGLLDFIGVDRQAELRLPEKEPAGKKPRWYLWNKAILSVKGVADCLASRLRLEGPWQRFKKWQLPLYTRILDFNRTRVKMDRSVRRSLREYYREDIRGLEALTGRCLDHWQ